MVNTSLIFKTCYIKKKFFFYKNINIKVFVKKKIKYFNNLLLNKIKIIHKFLYIGTKDDITLNLCIDKKLFSELLIEENELFSELLIEENELPSEKLCIDKKLPLEIHVEDNIINLSDNLFIDKRLLSEIHLEETIINLSDNLQTDIKETIINLSNNLCISKGKEQLSEILINKINIKFCVFLGREKNMKILHSYIELGLKNDIFNEYHMYDFSRNANDHHFILTEYTRLNKIYCNKIFLHNYDENIIFKNKIITKPDWSPFYKDISKSKETDVIIKCDDDILFIDIFSLKNAINDRINDKISFLIHSNCINNGVCAYYQSELFPNLKNYLNKYPTGGLLGILFEKPEISYAIHNQFSNDILKDINNINNYILEDKYINSRISINFILINGIDAKYLSDVKTDDEYQLSSFLPEKLLRPNKMKGDLITSHLSYSLQDKIILNREDILNNYNKIKDIYLQLTNSIVKNDNNLNLNILLPHNENNIFIIKNWIDETHFYIKNIETNKYLHIDYENDEFNLSLINKTIFQIKEKDKLSIEIKLGIYNITRYNSIGKFRNESMLFRYLRDDKERELMKIDICKNNSFYLKFLKYNFYFSVNSKNDETIDITNFKKSKWIFEKVNYKDPYIKAIQIIKNNKIYYKNVETNEIYTNYYMGWGQENILW